jgi:hypothetical protein
MPDTSLLHTHYWQAFSIDHDPADAVQRYAARYGKPPDHVLVDRGLLWVGPIPDDGMKQDRGMGE